MAKILSKVAPWSRSTRFRGEPGEQVTPSVRVLSELERPDLEALVALDPVSNIFLDSYLRNGHPMNRSGGRAMVLGQYDDAGLRSACWVGSNVVPVNVDYESGAEYGAALLCVGLRYSSIFGPSDGVMGIWSTLQRGHQQALDVRPHQPLMARSAPSDIPPVPTLRRARPDEFDVMLPACAAMFEEELGYSPLISGRAYYEQRVRTLIERGFSLVDRDPDGRVIFKAELGNVSPRATQIQGVWMNHSVRGQGLAKSYMSAVVDMALDVAPIVSLYVNDYNRTALNVYRRVGFEEIGEFATVLF